MLKIQTLIFLLFFGLNLEAQLSTPLPFNDNSSNLIQDTICFKYQLTAGDTLYYKISAFDSVVVNFEEPVLRRRLERIRFVVDSVDTLDRIHITRTMLNFLGSESNEEIKNVQKSSTPWLNKEIQYTIDRSGRRYSYNVSDSASAVLSPGGPFAPFLFFDLGIYCEERTRNWTTKSFDELAENGVPFPLFNHTTLFRFNDDIDTLGYKCHRLELIRTGQGSYEFPIEGEIYKTTTKINSGGFYDLSIEKGIPVHYMITQEQKTSIISPSGKKNPGWIYTTQYFILEEYIHSEE